jgi:hypothetical protein
MMMKIPRNTTMGSNVVAVPAASDFSSHCPAEIKEKILHLHIFYYMYILIQYSHCTKHLKCYLEWLETK